MKKINVRGILNPMSDKEMKNTTGGDNFKYSINQAPDAGGGGGDGCCIAISGMHPEFGVVYVGQSAYYAELVAGPGAAGWWCCNCPSSKGYC